MLSLPSFSSLKSRRGSCRVLLLYLHGDAGAHHLAVKHGVLVVLHEDRLDEVADLADIGAVHIDLGHGVVAGRYDLLVASHDVEGLVSGKRSSIHCVSSLAMFCLVPFCFKFVGRKGTHFFIYILQLRRKSCIDSILSYARARAYALQ